VKHSGRKEAYFDPKNKIFNEYYLTWMFRAKIPAGNGPIYTYELSFGEISISQMTINLYTGKIKSN
jgi:hypothetical protein